MTRFFNKKSQTIKRRLLRKNLQKAEIELWLRLKNKKLGGYKFRRQYSVDRYVIDFCCSELKLAIEIDGPYHNTDDMKIYDNSRDTFIKSLGIRILRFSNADIENNIENILLKIKQYYPLLYKEG